MLGQLLTIGVLVGLAATNEDEGRKAPLRTVSDEKERTRRDILDELKETAQNEHLRRRALYLQLSYATNNESERATFKRFAIEEGLLSKYKNYAESALNSKSINHVKDGLTMARKGIQLATEKQQSYFKDLVNELEKRRKELEEKIKAKKE